MKSKIALYITCLLILFFATSSFAYRYRGDGYRHRIHQRTLPQSQESEVARALETPVTELDTNEDLSSQDLCRLLGGSYARGKCILQFPYEICRALGGMWNGSRCKFAEEQPQIDLGEILDAAKRSVCSSMSVDGNRCYWRSGRCVCRSTQRPVVTASRAPSPPPSPSRETRHTYNVNVNRQQSSSWVPERASGTYSFRVGAGRYADTVKIERRNDQFRVCYYTMVGGGCGNWARIGNGTSSARFTRRGRSYWVTLRSRNTNVVFDVNLYSAQKRGMLSLDVKRHQEFQVYDSGRQGSSFGRKASNIYKTYLKTDGTGAIIIKRHYTRKNGRWTNRTETRIIPWMIRR